MAPKSIPIAYTQNKCENIGSSDINTTDVIVGV